MSDSNYDSNRALSRDDRDELYEKRYGDPKTTLRHLMNSPNGIGDEVEFDSSRGVGSTSSRTVKDVQKELLEDLDDLKYSLLGELIGIPASSKISRIKAVRASTGLNLRDAKFVVDQVNNEIGHVNGSGRDLIADIEQLQQNLKDECDFSKRFKRERDEGLAREDWKAVERKTLEEHLQQTEKDLESASHNESVLIGQVKHLEKDLANEVKLSKKALDQNTKFSGLLDLISDVIMGSDKETAIKVVDHLREVHGI